MWLRVRYKKKISRKLFFASLKTLKKGVGFGIGSGSDSGSAPKCQTPTLEGRTSTYGTLPGMTLVAFGNLILILEREIQPNLAPLRLHLFQLFLLGPALHTYPNSKERIIKNIEQNKKVCAS
jgi:hypothetical protein